MKIEIQNLGPIHRFEFDLEKDLHLLYGENNVGKSFAVNMIYCVLKGFAKDRKFSMQEYAVSYEDEKSLSFEVIIKDRIFRFWSTVLVAEINGFIANTYDKVVPLLDKNQQGGILKICFPSYYNVVLRLSDEGKLSLNVNDIAIQSELSNELARQNVEDNLETMKLILRIVGYPISLYSEIHFLPASRSGLYAPLSGMGEILAELSQARNLLSSKIELPQLSEPVASYYLKLVGLNGKHSSEGISSLAGNIEETILKGRIHFNSNTKKIYYLPDGAKESISITQTASMISELAPLVLYLKHLISSKRALVIIEEPEAHLHPKVQVQLMEIFAELTRHNVKVTLTSHSDFMFNKLSNMLLAKEIEPEKVAVYHMVMTEKGSIVKPDMQATEEGIEDHNFVEVSEDLYNERMNIYEELNEAQDATR